jgi:hypothetical protein
MNDTVHNLVAAIKTGDALATEQAFANAMAEKLAGKIEDLRVNIAQNMFDQVQETVQEEFTQEDWNNLSEEEQHSYDALTEGELSKAVRAHANAEVVHDERGDDESKTALKAAKNKMHSLAKTAGIKPGRATKVSHRLVNRYYGSDDGVKVKK